MGACHCIGILLFGEQNVVLGIGTGNEPCGCQTAAFQVLRIFTFPPAFLLNTAVHNLTLIRTALCKLN